MALDHYKAEFGEYPPDLFDNDALVRHVKKRWPRLDWSNLPSGGSPADQIRGAFNSAYGNGVDFTKPGAEIGSLALWLGGFPNSDGKLSGFYADPENPFTPINTFDQKAFVDLEIGEGKSVRYNDYFKNGGIVPVIGNDIRNVFVPIIYFRGRSSGGHDAYMVIDSQHAQHGKTKHFNFASTDLGFCVPYAEEESKGVIKWMNSSTFQLLHPGLDGQFGEPAPADPTEPPLRVIKTGDNIGPQNLDDQTNFSEYKEVKSILP
jgi:hypothetical protein